MRVHIADGYDPDVYGFSWDDFTSHVEYQPGRHTWVATVFTVTAPDTYTPVTGCVAGWDGRSVSLRTAAGDVVSVVPESVYILGDACPGHCGATS